MQGVGGLSTYPVRACGVGGWWVVYLSCEGMWCKG